MLSKLSKPSAFKCCLDEIIMIKVFIDAHFANCNDKYLLKVQDPLNGPFDTFLYVEQ